MVNGKIHSIQSFGTLDGPGIRFVVFMQGCFLHCLFCHNATAIPIESKNIKSSKEVFSKIESSKEYLQNGGVTISGGEPTLQSDFVKDLFEKCKKINLHTVLDTSLFCNKDILDELIPLTDLFLVSVKQFDEKKHIELTGKSNKIILENLKYVAHKKPVWVRYVIIPGFTDSNEDIKNLIKLFKELENAELIELLPYTKLGSEKWEKINEIDKLKNVKIPGRKRVIEIKEEIEKHEIKVLLED